MQSATYTYANYLYDNSDIQALPHGVRPRCRHAMDGTDSQHTIVVNTPWKQGFQGPALGRGEGGVLCLPLTPHLPGELTGLVNYICINLRGRALLPNSPGKS